MEEARGAAAVVVAGGGGGVGGVGVIGAGAAADALAGGLGAAHQALLQRDGPTGESQVTSKVN